MDVLVLTTSEKLSESQREATRPFVESMGERLGLTVILLDSGVTGHIERDLSPLIAAVTAQTEAIGLLIEALVEQGEPDEDDEPASTYLSGRKIN